MEISKKGVSSLVLIYIILVTLIPWNQFIYARAEETSDKRFIAPIEQADASAVKIYTAEELNAVRENMSGSYVLMNDIDLADYENWEPIGKTTVSPFCGKLDGQGHKITGLKVSVNINSASLNSPAHSVGLFGVCNGATIKNLELQEINVSIKNSSGYTYENSSINNTNIYAGGIAGCTVDQTIIYNCIISGDIYSETSQEALEAYAGGIVGCAKSTVISYTDNNCTVSASSANITTSANCYAGGLAGVFNEGGYIDHSSNHGNIASDTKDYGHSFAGGLIGKAVSSGEILEITDSFNTGMVKASAGNMFSDNSYAGGIAGSFDGTIDRVYVSGIVQSQVSSYIGGQAYAGGICGMGDGASVQNAAIVQSDVSASGTDGSSIYRISNGNCTKNNNITITQMASGSNNDADISKSLEEMRTEVPYAEILLWNFEHTWELSLENDFPQLKWVDTESEDYQSEYIAQHLAFIESSEYRNILENYRWAQIYWSEENNFASNAAGVLYNGLDTGVKIVSLDFAELFDNQNPYQIILADYVSDQSVINEIYQRYAIEVDNTLQTVYDVTAKYIKDNWKGEYGQLSDTDLFYLFHYDDKTSEEWINSDFPEHLEQIVSETKGSGAGLENIIKVSASTMDELWDAKELIYDTGTEFIYELLVYSAHVDAYIKSCNEFKEILMRMTDNIPDSDADRKWMMTQAITSYTSFNDEETIKADLYKQFEIGNNFSRKIVAKIYTKRIEDWLESSLSSAAFTMVKSIQWAADAGWKISEYITRNGELQNCRNMLRANADIEMVMYDTLKEIEAEFTVDQTIDNARLFDAAYRFFEETQIYSMDVCIAYMDTYQTAWLNAIRNLSAASMNTAIEEILCNKLYLYNTYCHGVSYNLGGKIIKIACPTDVYVYDSTGTQVAAIVNNMVVNESVDICAFATEDIKVIAVPDDQEYQIKISATGDGSMDYYMTEYDVQNNTASTIVYEEIPLISGKGYQGNISSSIKEDPSAYNLISDNATVIQPTYKINENNYIEISEMVIDKGISQIAVGESCTMNAKIIPDNASFQAIVWYSSNESIASVSTDGVLKGISEGDVVLTAYSMDGGKKDEVKIKVVSAEPQETIPVQTPASTAYPGSTPVPVLTPAPSVNPDPAPTETRKPAVPSGWPFKDVEVRSGNWKYENIKFVYENGIMTGVKADQFQPDAPLTRAMFASVIYRLADSPEVTYRNIFYDVPAGKWYSDAVIWAYDKGIVAGLGNDKYGINDNITREQMARMLMEFARVQGYETSERADFSKFADGEQVSSWAIEYMRWAVKSDVISGSIKDGKYYMNPKGQATRAECAVMLTKFIQKNQ